MGVMGISISDNYPSDYKFMGIDIVIDSTGYISQREVYTYLEWLGNIGGLTEAFKQIGQLLVGWISTRNSDF